MEYDVLVIGAGISGLAAARVCHNEGLSVALLEARDRPGGRIHSVTLPADPDQGLPDTVDVDLGANYLIGCSGSQTDQPLFHVGRLVGMESVTCAGDIGWKYRGWECAEMAVWRDHRTGEIISREAVGEMVFLMDKCLHRALWILQKSQKSATGSSDAQPSFAGLMQQALNEILYLEVRHKLREHRVLTDLEQGIYSALMTRYVSYVNPPIRLPLDFLHELFMGEALETSDRLNIFYPNPDTRASYFEHIESKFQALDAHKPCVPKGVSIKYEDRLVTSRFDQVVHAIKKDLDIRYNTVVRQIEWTDTGVVVTADEGGVPLASPLRCRYCVVSVPVGVLKGLSDRSAINFLPPLPPEKRSAIERLGIPSLGAATHNKAILRYRLTDVFWDHESPHLKCPDPRLHILNLHRYGKPGVLLAHIWGGSGLNTLGRTDAEIVEVMVDLLAGMYPKSKGIQPVQSRVTRWSEDVFALGSYTAGEAGSKGDEDRVVYGASLPAPDNPRLMFVGEGTLSTQYAKECTHGALQSGFERAQDLINLVHPGRRIPKWRMAKYLMGQIQSVDSYNISFRERKQRSEAVQLDANFSPKTKKVPKSKEEKEKIKLRKAAKQEVKNRTVAFVQKDDSLTQSRNDSDVTELSNALENQLTTDKKLSTKHHKKKMENVEALSPKKSPSLRERWALMSAESRALLEEKQRLKEQNQSQQVKHVSPTVVAQKALFQALLCQPLDDDTPTKTSPPKCLSNSNTPRKSFFKDLNSSIASLFPNKVNLPSCNQSFAQNHSTCTSFPHKTCNQHSCDCPNQAPFDPNSQQSNQICQSSTQTSSVSTITCDSTVHSPQFNSPQVCKQSDWTASNTPPNNLSHLSVIFRPPLLSTENESTRSSFPHQKHSMASSSAPTHSSLPNTPCSRSESCVQNPNSYPYHVQSSSHQYYSSPYHSEACSKTSVVQCGTSSYLQNSSIPLDQPATSPQVPNSIHSQDINYSSCSGSFPPHHQNILQTADHYFINASQTCPQQPQKRKYVRRKPVSTTVTSTRDLSLFPKRKYTKRLNRTFPFVQDPLRSETGSSAPSTCCGVSKYSLPCTKKSNSIVWKDLTQFSLTNFREDNDRLEKLREHSKISPATFSQTVDLKECVDSLSDSKDLNSPERSDFLTTNSPKRKYVRKKSSIYWSFGRKCI